MLVATAAPDDDPRRRLRRALARLARLSTSALPPAEFYVELLRAGLDGIEAPGGAVWISSPQGHVEQQCQQNIAQVGLDDLPDGRQSHMQLLRFAFEVGNPGVLGPRQRVEGHPAAGNPTDYAVALAPIRSKETHAVGLVEIFHRPSCHPLDLLHYTIQVAEFASEWRSAG